MLETLVFFFITADIAKQSKVLGSPYANNAQVEQAAERLCFYGEISYFQLKDVVNGRGGYRCRRYVWPRVLAQGQRG